MVPTRLSPLAKARLALEVVRAYRQAQAQLSQDDLPSVLAQVRAPAAEATGREVERAEALRLGRAVHRTLRVLPTDDRCLIQSVVLCALLARRGALATLVIGVRSGDDFGAHAWVELDGSPVIPSFEDQYTRFTEL